MDNDSVLRWYRRGRWVGVVVDGVSGWLLIGEYFVSGSGFGFYLVGIICNFFLFLCNVKKLPACLSLEPCKIIKLNKICPL